MRYQIDRPGRTLPYLILLLHAAEGCGKPFDCQRSGFFNGDRWLGHRVSHAEGVSASPDDLEEPLSAGGQIEERIRLADRDSSVPFPVNDEMGDLQRGSRFREVVSLPVRVYVLIVGVVEAQWNGGAAAREFECACLLPVLFPAVGVAVEPRRRRPGDDRPDFGEGPCREQGDRPPLLCPSRPLADDAGKGKSSEPVHRRVRSRSESSVRPCSLRIHRAS